MNQTDIKESSNLLTEAKFLWHIGDVQSLEKKMFSALATAENEKSLPSSLVDAIHEMAGMYCVKRKYGDAARLYRRVLSARERVLGENHPDLVDSLDKLSVVLREADSRSDAIAAQFRAMAIRSRTAPT